MELGIGLFVAFGLPVHNFWTFAFAGLAVVFAAVFFVGTLRSLRPVRISDGFLIVPAGWQNRSGLGRTQKLPIGDVAGIGFAFRFQLVQGRYYPPAWYLTFWKQADTPISSEIQCPVDKQFAARLKEVMRQGGHGLRSRDFDPVPLTDVEALSRSDAANVARSLYAHVVATQGTDGPLATAELQKHCLRGWRGRYPVYAWWSPDDNSIGAAPN